MAIADVAQIIMQHGATGPSEQPGLKVRNVFSPHYERLICEVIRGFLIKETQQAEAAINAEIASLRSLIPEPSLPQLDLTVARINELFLNIVK